MSLSASPLDELLEEAEFGSHWAVACTAKNRQYESCTISRAAEETGMHQQANANGTLPSQGDAINELFARHYGTSLRTAYRILRSKEDAEDAVQTACCAAFRNL